MFKFIFMEKFEIRNSKLLPCKFGRSKLIETIKIFQPIFIIFSGENV